MSWFEKSQCTVTCRLLKNSIIIIVFHVSYGVNFWNVGNVLKMHIRIFEPAHQEPNYEYLFAINVQFHWTHFDFWTTVDYLFCLKLLNQYLFHDLFDPVKHRKFGEKNIHIYRGHFLREKACKFYLFCLNLWKNRKWSRGQFLEESHKIQNSSVLSFSRENQTPSQLQWAKSQLNYSEFRGHVFWELGSNNQWIWAKI